MTDKDCEICQHQDDVDKATQLLRRAIAASLYSMIDKTEAALEEEISARAELEAFLASRPHLVPTGDDFPEESQQQNPPEEANR